MSSPYCISNTMVAEVKPIGGVHFKDESLVPSFLQPFIKSITLGATELEIKFKIPEYDTTGKFIINAIKSNVVQTQLWVDVELTFRSMTGEELPREQGNDSVMHLMCLKEAVEVKSRHYSFEKPETSYILVSMPSQLVLYE